MNRTNITHRNLLAEIDDCLADPDPKVRKEARKVAADCAADARSHLSFLRRLPDTYDAQVETTHCIQDFLTRAKG